MTHICVSKLTIIGSDNGLSPGRRQAIIWTNAGILSIGLPRTSLNEILIEIHTFPFKKMRLKISSAKWRPFCLGLNVFKTNDGRERSWGRQPVALHWRHNDHNGVSNHQPGGCLLNRLFRQIKVNIKAPRHWPLCGEFTGTGEFPAQRASYAENVSIWWRHHGFLCYWRALTQITPNDRPRRTSSPGPWFNIKISSYQYRKSHCGDKTVVWSSYLHNGISYTHDW